VKRRQTSSGMAKTDGVATSRRQVALKVKVFDGRLCLWRCSIGIFNSIRSISIPADFHRIWFNRLIDSQSFAAVGR
jgi:hypothetical protein